MTESLFGSTEASGWDIASAREDLASKLDGLRDRSGFPAGDDEAIVALSLPPFHTACPNPYITDWLEEARSDDADREDPGPYVTDITVGKGNAFYKAHSYPTKVPHPAIMRFLLHYTKPGDVVLDGFCGTGMTGLAAQACGAPDAATRTAIEEEMGKVRWGPRRAVLQDLSPSATFISAGMNLPIDSEKFSAASSRVLEAFQRDYGWMYETTHTDGRQVSIDYSVWSEVFTCPSCAAEIIFYDVAFDTATKQVRATFYCSSCNAELNKKALEPRRSVTTVLGGGTVERLDFRLVELHYRIGKQKYSKKPESDDLATLSRIAGLQVPPFPSDRIPYLHRLDAWAFREKGFDRVQHFWSNRALASLSVLWSLCNEEADPLTRHALLFWLDQNLWGFSFMNRFVPTHFSQVNRYLSGVYYVGSLHSEPSPTYNMIGSRPSTGKRESLKKVWGGSPAKAGNVMISTGSSSDLGLPDNSIDYVFVDPPFGENFYYSDLAYLIEAWHGVHTATEKEAIVDGNRTRKKSLEDYAGLMAECFTEFYRVLKPGRWMTVEFSNSSNKVWLAVQRALERSGFVVADTRILDKGQLSFRQISADSAAKKDLVISCYKPAISSPTEGIVGDGDPDTAWSFVREHLSHLPITDGRRGEARPIRERIADRLYDRMIAFHVNRRIPVPVTTTEFFAGLDQRFPSRDGMYFLDSQVESYERHRITIKDLLEDTLFITGESSAVQWLRQYLKTRKRPLPYSEIQPAFLSELGNGLSDWEELPELRALLEQNFVQDDEGRWYVPDPKKAADLEKLRRRSLLREFESYLSGTGKLTRFRSEAVRAGFDDAWDRREFDLIVKIGKRLPSDVLVEDPTLRYFVDNAEILVAG